MNESLDDAVRRAVFGLQEEFELGETYIRYSGTVKTAGKPEKDWEYTVHHNGDHYKAIKKQNPHLTKDEHDAVDSHGPEQHHNHNFNGTKIRTSIRDQEGEVLESMNEACKTMKEEEMTDAQMKKREEIVKSMKKSKGDFEKRYGDRAKDVMYATATKMAMREGFEFTEEQLAELEEAYGPSTKGYIKQGKSSYKGYLKRKHAAEVEKGGEPNPGKWSHPKNEEASNCKTMKEEEMTDAQMKKREEIVKSMKKKEDEFKAKYGDRWKDVMYATATKMAMKEGASWTKKEDFASDYAAQAKSQAVFGKSTPEIDITQKAAKAAVNTVKGVLSKIKGKPAPNDSANSKGGDTSVAP